MKINRTSHQETTTVLQSRKLLDQVRNKIRFKHYGLSTENTYISWIRQFILHHGKRHPGEIWVPGWNGF
ncbi:MAG: hypothetical protein CVU17_00805 [Betaproteobacteria bacterium HGW-Betaproteobacteria-11]|nr:MAG: hypothetical protein CVU17_00805 [Betaproteobacteria bacterium HGW-Betaproteobacteria-11]